MDVAGDVARMYHLRKFPPFSGTRNKLFLRGIQKGERP